MKAVTILLTLWGFMVSYTEAQHRTNNRGGVFSFRGGVGQHGFSMLSPQNSVPPRFNIRNNAPTSFNRGGSVPFTHAAGINVPSNTGSSIPLIFNAGRYFPVNFNTGNTIFPRNMNTGNTMDFSTGNGFAPNTVNTVPADISNNLNIGNRAPSSLNNLNSEISVPSFNTGSISSTSFNTGTNRPIEFDNGRNNPSNDITKKTFSGISRRNEENYLSNRIDFLDPTENGRADLGVNWFSDFGVKTESSTISPTLNSKGFIWPHGGLHAIGVHSRNKPQNSGQFGPTQISAATVSGTTDSTVSEEFGFVSDTSQIPAAQLGKIRGNFKTTNTNPHMFSPTSQNQQVDQTLWTIPSFMANTDGGVTNPNRHVPTTKPPPFLIKSPQSSQPPFTTIPPQHPINPTTAFDLMGNLAGPFHDPLMFFGLNEMMDLDVMDGTFFNAISNPISAITALQMRVQATPSINLMTSSSSNVHTSPFLSPPDSTENNGQIRTQPDDFQSLPSQNLFTRQANHVFQPRNNQFQTQNSRNPSQNPFRENWNTIMARSPIPPGVQFLSQTIPGMTENFHSRNFLPTQQSSWFDPTFGIALDEAHDPRVKITKIYKGNAEDKTQSISVGKEASIPIRVRALARANTSRNPAYTNTSPF